MENVKFKGRDISLEDFLKEIFEEIPASKISLSIDELKKYATEDIFSDKNLEAFEEVRTAQDLENFINHPKTQGKGVKDLLIACLTDKNISFNEKAFNPCGKNHLILIFSNVFDFGTENVQVTTESTNETPKSPSPETAPKIEMGLGEMQIILDGCKLSILEDIDATQFELTENMPVTLMNEFYMVVPENLQIDYGAAAVITKNEPHKVAAVGSLQLHEGKTHILLQEKNIDYEIFKQQSNFYIVLFPQTA